MLKRTLLVTNPCHVSARHDQLIFERKEIEGRKSVPPEDLGFLLIEHPQSTITQAVIDLCCRHNVALIFCDAKHMPNAMVLRLSGHHIQQARFQDQIKAGTPLKKQLWRQTITAKLHHQADALDRVADGGDYLRQRAGQVLSGDAGNEEARGAAHYWRYFFGPAFKRMRDGHPPNAHLNYGYAILRAAMARALSGAGLLPALGIHHRNQYNDYCLADDLMEPYRPFADLAVHAIYRRENRRLNEVEATHKTELLRVLTADCLLHDKVHPLMNAMQKTAWSLAQCYGGQRKRLMFARIPEPPLP